VARVPLLLALLLVAPLEPRGEARAAREDRLRAELIVRSRFIRVHSRVDVTLFVHDPHQGLHCPEFHLDYGDGSSATVPDCYPYGWSDERPLAHAFTRRVPWRTPGPHVIRGWAWSSTTGEVRAEPRIVCVLGPSDSVEGCQ
jgi:hypothetical protein